MNRIDARFAALRKEGQAAFIPYITAGDPTLDDTARYVLALERAGASVVELGVPFSDPLADGTVNQEAALRALKGHVSLRNILGMVKELRRDTEIPIVLFSYFNPVLAYGVEAFARDAAEAGVDGLLCVDLPLEETEAYGPILHSAGLATVFLIAPTSPDDRVKRIAEASSGFIYYVSRTGVTGAQESVETAVKGMVAAIRRHTDKPVAVGFGISTPEQAREVAAYADGVVVGSAIVRLIGELGGGAEAAEKVAAFAAELADGVRTSRRPMAT